VSPLVAILILLLLAAVVFAVSAPLRQQRAEGREPGAHASGGHAPGEHAPNEPAPGEREQLEAAREAKYREIRDSELDFRTGKLSAEDYAAVDAQLRAEALDILDRLERLAGPPAGAPKRGVRPRDA
jgi:hypothetical protein